RPERRLQGRAAPQRRTPVPGLQPEPGGAAADHRRRRTALRAFADQGEGRPQAARGDQNHEGRCRRGRERGRGDQGALHKTVPRLMSVELPKTSVAEALAAKIAALQPGMLPAATVRKCEDLLIDVVGLCVTARNEDYVRGARAGCD